MLSRLGVLARHPVLPLLGERAGVRGKAPPEVPAIPIRPRPAAFRFSVSHPATITRPLPLALRPALEFGRLEFEVCLEFRVWDLDFFCSFSPLTLRAESLFVEAFPFLTQGHVIGI